MLLVEWQLHDGMRNKYIQPFIFTACNMFLLFPILDAIFEPMFCEQKPIVVKL